tara:strand:- start:2006 stop:2659 length:654 start_codon:yes stop_codon:yes gene_type:complete
MSNGSNSCHLIGKNEEEISRLSDEMGFTYSTADVLEENFIEQIEKDVSGFDISGIAYCIGSIDLKPINLISKKDVLKCFSLNLFPIYEIVKKFQNSLKKNKGSIVLFSTVAVKQGFPNHSIISPAKASVEGLTVSLASELSPNVRVNCIAPSMSNSKMASKILKNPKIAEGIAKQHPLKRLGEGKDSAALAKFLLSNDSSWITGQIIGVDGGRSNIG